MAENTRAMMQRSASQLDSLTAARFNRLGVEEAGVTITRLSAGYRLNFHRHPADARRCPEGLRDELLRLTQAMACLGCREPQASWGTSLEQRLVAARVALQNIASAECATEDTAFVAQIARLTKAQIIGNRAGRPVMPGAPCPSS